MKYSVVLDRLQNLINYTPNQSELCKITGVKQSTMSVRSTRDSDFTSDEIVMLNKYYKINLFANEGLISNNITNTFQPDRIEINYWSELPEALKNPKVVSCWFDKEIVENAWGMSAEHLCIVPMVGDKMSRYWYPIRSGDILIVDMSQDYIMGNGVYFATSRNNTRFWIREMQVLFNNSVEFKGFSPSGDTTKVISSEQLQEAGFKIIGKVIKNVSFRL